MERPTVALVAASVVRRTTGWVAARHEMTCVVVAGEEEEQLQTQIQTQNPTQPPHPRLCARAAEP